MLTLNASRLVALSECVPVQVERTSMVNTSSQDKLTEEELTERMARIREQNEKIKQRRLVRFNTARW